MKKLRYHIDGHFFAITQDDELLITIYDSIICNSTNEYYYNYEFLDLITYD